MNGKEISKKKKKKQKEMANKSPISTTSPSSEKLSDHSYKTKIGQYLFLLEFFIHYITGERLAKLNQMFFVPTSVSLQFLDIDAVNNDIVEITPVDPMFSPLPGITSANNDSEHFYSGRSILFAVPECSVASKDTEFKIKLDVCKKMPEGFRPDISVGSGELDLTEEFAELRKEMLHCWHRDIPPPKYFEGPVELYHEHESTAVAMVFARISGFGQSIVTEFETPHSNKLASSSFVFKGDKRDDRALAYKCRILSQSHMDNDNDSNDLNGDLIKTASVPYYCRPCGEESGAKVIAQRDDTIADIEASNNNTLIQSSRGKPCQPCGNPIVLKVSGLLMDEDGRVNKPTVTVGSQGDRRDGHDVFVLRIGKKGIVGEGEKSDIQVEMRTPKGPERSPPIRYETREIQTDLEEMDEDVKKVETKPGESKKKKKKKKGKAKKKKKKKK